MRSRTSTRRSTSVCPSSRRSAMAPALGKEKIELLDGRDHAQDPTLVLFALHA
ncbi:hypothetical protein BD311DRAFT_559867 [Dichomitus squalens]|uniref:Uncharacterized protein n=1 Tax=Dichomitus squalens TaxID=114155 RepID=A0A4Q9MDI5_9APHY|nr:hypothetical protein BD311DRAFT_559867 [Dichomitus squalens]